MGHVDSHHPLKQGVSITYDGKDMYKNVFFTCFP